MAATSSRTTSSGAEVTDEYFAGHVKRELTRARDKFPSSAHSMTALVEEVGELAQALLKWSAGKWDYQRVIDEAVQVAAMAHRVAVEGDPSFGPGGTHYAEP